MTPPQNPDPGLSNLIYEGGRSQNYPPAVMTKVPNRLNNAELAAIGQRLRTPMNDDGMRAWYKTDVNSLLEEVIALRRDRVAAMQEFATHPPLEGIDQSADLADVAAQLSTLWTEQQQGLWQKAEVKKLRDKLAAAEQSSASAEARVRLMGEQIATLQARLTALAEQLAQTTAGAQAQVTRLVDATATAEGEARRLTAELAETNQKAVLAINSTRADAQRRIEAVNEELRLSRAENQSMREEVGQAITANQREYAAKADRAREALRGALLHFEG